MTILARMVAAQGGVRVNINDATTTDTTASPFNPNATYALTNGGDVQTNAGSIGSWITPTSAAGAGYDVRLTYVSGDTITSGTAGSWLSLGTTRNWGLSTTIVGTVSGVYTAEIRNASTLAVLDSATITFTATKTL